MASSPLAARGWGRGYATFDSKAARAGLFPGRRAAVIVIIVGQSAARAVAGGVHGFAPALTSFVGRADVVAKVAGLLGERRLVTVTGPGGSGKSRLAAEVAKQMGSRFADGVWLVELAAVRDPAQVPSVVAAVLGAQERPEEPTVDAVARILAEQQLLLVLDNCEHVAGAAAELCAGLLPAADDVRVLATSREPLRMAGEARYRLAPLSLPGPDDPAGAQSEAVALFADRARRADPGLALDGETAPVVARLVRRLDGMPLAIELAAARVDALGVAQLVDCLDDRFALLTAADRLAPGRQKSLAGTVDWSYKLLEERERRAFRSLSVFPGPFTLEAAEAVAGPEAGNAVLHLVDCSLVVPPRADPDGRSRYALLETLRVYGRQLLSEADEQQQAESALAGYALGVAEQAAAGLQRGTREAPATRWLRAEGATVRHALAWALENDQRVAVRLAAVLAPWWYLRGRSADGYPLLRRAARHAAAGSEAWCIAHYWLGRMALFQADLSAALGHFSTVVGAITRQQPSPALADCLSGRAMTLANLGQVGEAVKDGRRALAQARELDYPVGQIRALVGLNFAARQAGDFDSALHTARQIQQVRADLPAWMAQGRNNSVVKTLVQTGNLEEAERICADELARSRDDGDQHYIAIVLMNVATLDLAAKRIQEAAAHLRESLQLAT